METPNANRRQPEVKIEIDIAEDESLFWSPVGERRDLVKKAIKSEHPVESHSQGDTYTRRGGGSKFGCMCSNPIPQVNNGKEINIHGCDKPIKQEAVSYEQVSEHAVRHRLVSEQKNKKTSSQVLTPVVKQEPGTKSRWWSACPTVTGGEAAAETASACVVKEEPRKMESPAPGSTVTALFSAGGVISGVSFSTPGGRITVPAATLTTPEIMMGSVAPFTLSDALLTIPGTTFATPVAVVPIPSVMFSRPDATPGEAGPSSSARNMSALLHEGTFLGNLPAGIFAAADAHCQEVNTTPEPQNEVLLVDSPDIVQEKGNHKQHGCDVNSLVKARVEQEEDSVVWPNRSSDRNDSRRLEDSSHAQDSRRSFENNCSEEDENDPAVWADGTSTAHNSDWSENESSNSAEDREGKSTKESSETRTPNTRSKFKLNKQHTQTRHNTRSNSKTFNTAKTGFGSTRQTRKSRATRDVPQDPSAISTDSEQIGEASLCNDTAVTTTGSRTRKKTDATLRLQMQTRSSIKQNTPTCAPSEVSAGTSYRLQAITATSAISPGHADGKQVKRMALKRCTRSSGGIQEVGSYRAISAESARRKHKRKAISAISAPSVDRKQAKGTASSLLTGCSTRRQRMETDAAAAIGSVGRKQRRESALMATRSADRKQRKKTTLISSHSVERTRGRETTLMSTGSVDRERGRESSSTRPTRNTGRKRGRETASTLLTQSADTRRKRKTTSMKNTSSPARERRKRDITSSSDKKQKTTSTRFPHSPSRKQRRVTVSTLSTNSALGKQGKETSSTFSSHSLSRRQSLGTDSTRPTQGANRVPERGMSETKVAMTARSVSTKRKSKWESHLTRVQPRNNCSTKGRWETAKQLIQTMSSGETDGHEKLATNLKKGTSVTFGSASRKRDHDPRETEQMGTEDITEETEKTKTPRRALFHSASRNQNEESTFCMITRAWKSVIDQSSHKSVGQENDDKDSHNIQNTFSNNSDRKQKTLNEQGEKYTATKACQISERNTGCDDDPYSCTECNASFSRLVALRGHRKTDCTDQSKSSKQCNADCSSSTWKQRRRRQSRENLFACTQCTAIFSGNALLNRHLQTHATRKPFPCQDCNAQFAHQSSLINHEKKKHSRWNVACEDCGKTFIRPSWLEHHMKKHSKQTPSKV